MRKSCFVSAPFGADTSVLRELIEAHGVTVVDGRSLQIGAPLYSSIGKAIQSATYFVAVVPGQKTPASTLFELGMAVGLAKRVALIAGRSVDVPPDLKGLLYLRADPQDARALKQFLTLFFKRAQSIAPTSRTSAERSTHRVPSQRLAQLSLRAEKARTAMAFERSVRAFFDDAGYVLSSPLERQPAVADFAVWFEDLEGAFSNPALVEVKWQLASQASLNAAEAKLRLALAEREAGLGLLICKALPLAVEQAATPQWPLVIRMSVASLGAALRRGMLEREILNVRNALVHGSRES